MSEQPAGALVVLRPAGGGDVTGGPITAADVGRHAPDPQAAERARRAFADAGFEVGELVGISFSIAGPRRLLEAWFPGFVKLEGTGAELPLDRLPSDVAETVQAVVTEAPPEFGPVSY
jgi:hypothetical protein